MARKPGRLEFDELKWQAEQQVDEAMKSTPEYKRAVAKRKRALRRERKEMIQQVRKDMGSKAKRTRG